MPGIFSKANRPRRPGAYFNFEAVQAEPVPISTGATVGLAINHNWGPFKTAVKLRSFADFQAVFGNNGTTSGARAVHQAFKGEGVDGRGGAGQVIVYRYGATAAAKATKVLQNTTPAAALTLSARYEGTKGNDLKVTVQDYTADNSLDELIIYDGTTEVERYRYANTDINDLAAQINGTGAYLGNGSDWVTAVANISGVALTTVASSAFAGGNDGGTNVTGANLTATQAAFETERFSVFAWDQVAEASWDATSFPTGFADALASLKTWAVNLNKNGKRFILVVGGLAGESITTANTRSNTLASPLTGEPSYGENFVNLGVGSYVDDALTTLNSGTTVTLSTSQLAPRIAGILASRGESLSLTFARLADISTITLGATEAEILSAFDNGTTVLARDSHPSAPVRIEKGLTTYVATNNTAKPYLIFRNPKFVRTIHGIELELTEYAESNIIGRIPVNDKSREDLAGTMLSSLQARESVSVLQPGSTVAVDTDPPPSDDDEFIALRYGIRFGRSVEQVFNTVRVA